MPHDWGVQVPDSLSTEEVFEIRDKLRTGAMTIELPESIQGHEKAAQWREEMNTQALAAYELEAARRMV